MKNIRYLLVLACLSAGLLTQSGTAQATPHGGPPFQRHFQPPVHVRQKPFQPAATTTPTGYTPAQIRQAYGFNQLSADGTGQTIAIIDAFGDQYVTGTTTVTNITGHGHNLTTNITTTVTSTADATWTDWTNFCGQFGLTTNGLTVVYPQGQPTVNTNWGLETALDIEWAHAIAPGAKILLVVAYGNSGADLFSAVDYAVTNGANVVSMSWGAGEYSGETSLDAHFNHPGVTFVASSGDAGEYASGNQYPSASPYVLSVGGTQLSTNVDGTWSETAWSGSGGGISLYEAMPLYQNGWQQFPTGNMRSVPDVCYQGGPNPGVAVYCTPYGGWIQVYGTSVSAPQWAASIALANSASSSGTVIGNDNSLLYSIAATGTNAPFVDPDYLFDITAGTNGSDLDDAAIPGYDFVSGLGSPMANNLVPALATVLDTPNFSLSVSPASATVPTTGGTAIYTIGINRSGGYSDGVDLSAASNPALPAGATASFSPNPATDSSTLTLSVPANTTPGTYSLTITGTGTGTLSGTTRTAGVDLTVSSSPTSVYVALPSGTDGYAVSGGRSGTKNLTVTVALVNDFGQPVAGASVSAQVNVVASTLMVYTGTATTASDGTATFTIRNAPAGTYTTKVTNISGTSLSWDGTTPANSYLKTQ